MRIEARLEELGLALPEPVKPAPGIELSFAWIRVRGDRAYVSDPEPLNPDGSITGPFGKVGVELRWSKVRGGSADVARSYRRNPRLVRLAGVV